MMNSFSTYGVLVALLFVYCTPSQGQSIAVSNVTFENGGKYKSTNLIKSSNGTYKIEGSEVTFGIETIDTIVGNDVVLRTNDNSNIQMELVNSQDSLQLFDTTTRSKLGGSLYSCNVSVYKYKEGLISNDVFLSEFGYSISGNSQSRFVVHSEGPLSTELKPLLLWTGKQFGFLAWFHSIILILRVKPADDAHQLYLVNFRSHADLKNWMVRYGRSNMGGIGANPGDAYKYFHDFMTTNYYNTGGK